MRGFPWIVLGLLGSAPALAAPKDLRPCAPVTAEYTRAAAALEALNLEIAELAPDADPAPLIARVEKMARLRCFALLDGGPGLDTSSALALRTWWNDGGHQYLRSYLDLGKPGPHLVHEPPSVRRTMEAAFPPGHPVASLVCPPAETGCGTETDFWAERLQKVLDRAGDEHPCVPSNAAERRRVPPSDPDACGAFVARAPRRQRFRRFTECLAQAAPTPKSVPLGRLRAPAEGWLVVSGRRGHYGFCDEVRAFDLATGAAFRVASCGGLFRREGGAVDHRATDRGRKVEIEIGQVSREAIRRSAWTLLLLDALEPEQREGFSVALPDSTAPILAPSSRQPPDPNFGRSTCFGGTFSSDQTTLSWRVDRNGLLLGAGKLTYPRDDDDHAAAYALWLLREAERGFVASCPAARPPRGLFDEGLALSASKLDTDAASLGAADGALGEAWRRALVEAETCR